MQGQWRADQPRMSEQPINPADRARSVLDVLLGRHGPGGPGEETWHQRFVRLAPPATLFGLLVSLIVHLLIGVIAGLITFRGAQAGGAGPEAGAVEFAVVTEAELAQMQEAGLDLAAPTVPDVPMPDLPAVELFDTQATSEVTELTGDLGDAATTMGAGDISGGSDLGVGGSGGGAASFFGVEARGTRFAYIVDISGSMGVGGKIESLRRELSKSVSALLENTQFLIVLFSTDAAPLAGRREWVAATNSGKNWARKNVADIPSTGSTNPLPAFQIVFTMRPKPDAIYFMTDGEFDPEVAMIVAGLNADYKIPIHCIAFVSRDAEAVMKQIAATSGGTYTFVPGASK